MAMPEHRHKRAERVKGERSTRLRTVQARAARHKHDAPPVVVCQCCHSAGCWGLVHFCRDARLAVACFFTAAVTRNKYALLRFLCNECSLGYT